MYNFTLTYVTCDIFGSVYSFFISIYGILYFPVLPIKYLINEDGEPSTPSKLATGKKPSVSYLRVLFCPCVVRKATSHVGTKALNIFHQAQKGFQGIFVGIPHYQKEYLFYAPHTQKIIFSYNVIFDEIFSIALAYMSQSYTELMGVQSDMV